MADWLSNLENEKRRKEAAERETQQELFRKQEQERREVEESYKENQQRIQEIYNHACGLAKRASDGGLQVVAEEGAMRLTIEPRKSSVYVGSPVSVTLTPKGQGLDVTWFDRAYKGRVYLEHNYIALERIDDAVILSWVQWVTKDQLNKNSSGCSSAMLLALISLLVMGSLIVASLR